MIIYFLFMKYSCKILYMDSTNKLYELNEKIVNLCIFKIYNGDTNLISRSHFKFFKEFQIRKYLLLL